MSGYDEGYTFPPNVDPQDPEEEEEEKNEEIEPQDVDFYAVLNVAKEVWFINRAKYKWIT